MVHFVITWAENFLFFRLVIFAAFLVAGVCAREWHYHDEQHPFYSNVMFWCMWVFIVCGALPLFFEV